MEEEKDQFYDGGATAFVAVAKEAYGLWQSSQEERRKKKMLKLLKAINHKLDIVIQKQDEILRELRALRVWFAEELRQQFLREVQLGMANHRDSFEVVADLASVDRREALQRFEELELPTRNFCFNILDRGVATFPSAMAASLVHIAVLGAMREVGQRENVVDRLELGFLRKWEERFVIWFNPANQQGITYPMNQLTAARAHLQQQIENYPKRHSLGDIPTGREHSSGNRTCVIKRPRTLVINGDFQTGFSDRYVDGADFVSDQCYVDRWDRWGPAAGAIPDLLLKDYDYTDPLSLRSKEKLLEEEPTGSYYDNARRIAFGSDEEKFVPVNHPITQRLKALHAEWVKAVAAEAAYASFFKIVQDTRAQMALRAQELD